MQCFGLFAMSRCVILTIGLVSRFSPFFVSTPRAANQFEKWFDTAVQVATLRQPWLRLHRLFVYCIIACRDFLWKKKIINSGTLHVKIFTKILCIMKNDIKIPCKLLTKLIKMYFPNFSFTTSPQHSSTNWFSPLHNSQDLKQTID